MCEVKLIIKTFFVGEIRANLKTCRVPVATEVSYLVTILYTVNNVVQKIDVK